MAFWDSVGLGNTYGFGTFDSGNKGDNTFGAKVIKGVSPHDPLTRWLGNHTTGWLQDPGAAIVRWLGVPEPPRLPRLPRLRRK